MSLTQTKNTTTLFRIYFTKAAIAEYEIDIGKEITYAHHGAQRIEAVTSSPATLEGARATFVLKNEALALDTVLPTPNGWTTVGGVGPGDVLYGSAGPVVVTGVTPVYVGRPCFRVTFEDGATIVADAGHLWTTKVNGSQALPQVRTTAEMHDDDRSFAVPLAGVIDSPAVTLPIDPYVLGLWLGDGDSASAGVTAGAQDADEILAIVRARGIPAAKFTKTGDGRAKRISLQGNTNGDRYTKDGTSARGALVALGVLNNKHVPSMCLRASASQRLDLLRGLMDSDGCISAGARAIFVNQTEAVARGVAELANSLGYRVEWRETIDERWSRPRHGYRVAFRADEDVNPFRLSRKASAVRGHRRPWKSVRSIEPVPSVPVKCIQVDASDALFAAGEHWTLTHNTHHWLSTNEGHEMDAVISRNAAKAPDGASRVLAITNAYEPGEESVAQIAREAYESIAAGRSVDVGFLYDSIEAPPEATLDPETLPATIEAIRGDATWLDIPRIIQEIMDKRNPPSRSRRFWLNQIVATEDAWVSPLEWDALKDESEVVENEALIALGFDGGKTDDNCALMGVRISDGFTFTLGVWAPEEHGGEAPKAEIDRTVRDAFARFDVVAFFSDVAEWESFILQWELDFGTKLCAWSSIKHAIAWDMRGSTKVFTQQGAEATHDEIVEGTFHHDGNLRVRQHVHNARRRPNAYGWSFGKEHRESPRKVDALAALILARMARRAYLQLPKHKQRRERRKAVFF